MTKRKYSSKLVAALARGVRPRAEVATHVLRLMNGDWASCIWNSSTHVEGLLKLSFINPLHGTTINFSAL